MIAAGATPLADAALVRVGGPHNARPLGGDLPSTPPRPLAEIATAVAAARDDGARLVVFVGGEPTVRPDLAALLALPVRAGLGCGLVTSGRALAYPAVRARLVAAEVRYLRIALHGADAATHDALVGVPGAFAQTTEGLGALAREAGPATLVEVACTVVAPNAGGLAALAERVARLPCRASIGLRFVAPAGGLEPGEWPSPEAPREVAAALARALALAPDLVASWEGFPPCLLPDHAGRRDETLRWGTRAYGPAEAGGAAVREPPDGRRKPYPCQDCAHDATCPGAPAPLLERWGEAALAPTRAVRANSFNFEHVRDLGALAPSSGAGCAVRARLAGAHVDRDLVLVRDGRATHYRSPTSDFTDGEVRRSKVELEQVYLDVSETAALTDFTSGVRRVRLHAACAPCLDRAACPGGWEIDPEPPFAREERWLRKEVSRAHGRVLDVGCGEQPYRDEIAAGIAGGRIQYQGLDPDAAALERFRAAGIGGTLHLGTIEEFTAPEGFFDYVLVFRSLNHFRDLERAFAVIERVLRVEGMLYVCDSVVFGMLRTPAQVRFADEHAPYGHEHYRNWSSHQLLEFLERYRFRIDAHRPVNRQTSNQWMLKLMRVAERGGGGGAP